jgi:hypothetical protein
MSRILDPNIVVVIYFVEIKCTRSWVYPQMVDRLKVLVVAAANILVYRS